MLLTEVRIKPIYNENYEGQWGKIDYTGKAVLDIGGDYGSTADYFLRKGAKKVIAVDRSRDYISRLREFIKENKEERIEALHIDVNSEVIWKNMIEQFRPDVVKSDCEGCESTLFDIDDKIFSSVPEYIIEVHTNGIFDKMKKKCKECNYDIIDVNAWAGVVKIVYARKRD